MTCLFTVTGLLVLTTHPPGGVQASSAASNDRKILASARLASLSNQEAAVAYVQTTVHGVPVKAVTVDLNVPGVKVTGMIARGGGGRSESWSRMIDRARPVVAVTGTFFGKKNLQPIGDLVIGGELAHFGGKGTALCVTDGNVASFRKVPLYRHVDWSGCDFVLRCGPRLVWQGLVSVYPHHEGFRDPAILRRTGRVGVGVTESNKMLLVVTREPITLWQFAKVMKALGARDAINLDAGASTGLYYRGKTLIEPKRPLTNLLLVYTDPERYASVQAELMPSKTARR